MIFDMESSKELFAKYEAARAAEDTARKALLAAFESGIKDSAALGALSDRMESAHNYAMDIWDELQQFRLDK